MATTQTTSTTQEERTRTRTSRENEWPPTRTGARPRKEQKDEEAEEEGEQQEQRTTATGAGTPLLPSFRHPPSGPQVRVVFALVVPPCELVNFCICCEFPFSAETKRLVLSHENIILARFFVPSSRIHTGWCLTGANGRLKLLEMV